MAQLTDHSVKWRTSKTKEDARNAAEKLDSVSDVDISPYSVDQLSDVIRAGARTGSIDMVKDGRSKRLVNLEEWFTERVLPNTISLTREDYMTAMANSFELLTIDAPAKTDFGMSRQREFGQQWTDFTRGYLGEIAFKRFLEENYGIKVNLRQRDAGSGVEEYLPTDVVEIEEDGQSRRVDEAGELSIKTSKLGSLWLAVPQGQIHHSSAFAFVKIGIPLDHLAVFLKESGALDELLPHLHDKAEEQEILDTVPSFSPIPVYIPGFCWRNQLETGGLEMREGSKHLKVVGGIGPKPAGTPDHMSGRVKFEGLQDPHEEYFGACGALNWTPKEWNELLEKM